MNYYNKISTILLAIICMLSLTGPVVTLAAAVAPTWGNASGYSILGGAAITNTGASSATGDVGVSPGTAIGIGIGGAGAHHSNDTSAQNAQIDATSVYNDLNQPCDFGPTGPTDLAGAILTPGVHCYSSSAQISVGGILHLDANGETNPVWIFKLGSTLTTITGASVVFDNTGSACNVFWQIGSSATLGGSTAFIGNIIAAEDITLVTSATVNGKILARGISANGTVVLDTNAITTPTCAVPVTGTCGPAATSYLYTDTAFSGAKCTLGNGITTPASPTFPTVGNSVTWTCGGSNGGGSSGVCTATRAATPVAGVCGTAATTPANHAIYAYTGSTDVFSTTAQLCSAGTVPTAQTLPAPGGSTVTWTCTGQNTGADATCTATRAASATLTLVKTIIGGTKTFANFPLTATGTTTITGASATPTVTNAAVTAGSYVLSEVTQTNYTAGTWSCIKNTDPAVIGSSITLVSGDSAICTIQNTYTAPPTAGMSSYQPVAPLIEVVKVPSPLALPNGPGAVTYTYTIRNIGTVPMINVTIVDNKCSPMIFVSGDTNADSKLDLTETWTYNCFSTLSNTTTNTVTATGWANSISAIDIANATVVVGDPVIPPLIHITKVPNPLSLSAKGGIVTYTNKVTNPGNVALSNIVVVDDKCSALTYVSGDTNNDSKLDLTETWTYTCSTNHTKTTTNTVVATGQANGLIARDFAIATVIVATPTLPNTGFSPNGKWNIALLLGTIILISLSTIIALKKRKI